MLYIMWFVLSLAAGWLGSKREFGFWGFFLASLLLTPVIVLLVLAVTQPVEKKKLPDVSS